MFTTFSTSQLLAISHFSPKTGIRYYLNGVFIEVMENETRLVATDGHTLAVARNVEVSNAENFSVIIPHGVVELALKMKLNICRVECLNGQWNINGISFTPVDGKFPDYRRVIPTDLTNEVGQFNPEYLARVAKAGKSLKIKEYPTIRHNGLGGAIAHFNNYSHFMAIIMPVRQFTEKSPDNGIPQWAKN